jgi:hypothetical protein
MGYMNPLLKLPAAQRILALPDSPEKRLLEQLLREMRADALVTAEKSWRKRKGPMAAYWLAVATYCRHIAILLKRRRLAAANDDRAYERRVA